VRAFDHATELDRALPPTGLKRVTPEHDDDSEAPARVERLAPVRQEFGNPPGRLNLGSFSQTSCV